MIKKYFEFVNESFDLILESNVVYSDKMKDALNKMSDPLADILLGIENKDIPVVSNYFDIIDLKNDALSFIPDRKAQEILNSTDEMVVFNTPGRGWLKHTEGNQSIFDKLGYTPKGDHPYSPSAGEVGKVISRATSETTGNIYTYVEFENGKGVYNDYLLNKHNAAEDKLWSKGRQELKVGRAIRAILKAASIKFTDKDIETFVNSFKSTIDKMNDKFSLFEVVEGEKINYWYDSRRYYMIRGTLGSSCMSNVSYFDIYVSNPDVCKLVILKSQNDQDKITARALLWTLRDGKKFMDRIYTINDSDVNLFRDYAKINGWYYKSYNGSSADNEAVGPDGEEIEIEDMTVSIKEDNYDNYPYMDTFKYWDSSEGTLSTEESYGDTLALEQTNGKHYCNTCEGEGLETCPRCDGDCNIECEQCEGRGRLNCEYCDGNGNTTCKNCDGDGTVDSDGTEIVCQECDGDGTIECIKCHGECDIECEECNGDGAETCSSCDGDGNITCSDCNQN